MAMKELVLPESLEEGSENSLLCEPRFTTAVGREKGQLSAHPIAWMARMPIRIPMVLASAAAIHPIRDIMIEAIYTGYRMSGVFSAIGKGILTLRPFISLMGVHKSGPTP